MPFPSVTYTFANATTADATEVNTNFTDIINGLIDGTKNLSISALTCAGTATFNGNVVLGDATADDISGSGRYSTSRIPATNNAIDLGTTLLRWKDLWLSGNATITGNAAVTGTGTFTGQLIGAGTATNDTAAAGVIGQYLEGTGTNVTLTTTQSADGASVSLTAGCWDVQAYAKFDTNSNDTKLLECFIGTVTGNDSTGLDFVRNYASIGPNGTGSNLVFNNASYDTSLVTPQFRVNLASTTTYYCKVRSTFGSGVLTMTNGLIRATRIR